MEQGKTYNTGNLGIRLSLVAFAIGLGVIIFCLFTTSDKKPNEIIKIQQIDKF